MDEILKHYNSLKKDDESGHVDVEKTWEVMKCLKTNSGRQPTDEEVERAIMTCAGDEKYIDFVRFIMLWCRVKQIRN